MELLTENLTKTKTTRKNSIPVMGVESGVDSLGEYRDDIFFRTAECAYYKAQSRSFEPGHEMEDWLAAEAEVTQ
ncbi:MAG: DUF2934 domain-containing protein [Betaproteobacteria bacterium]